MHLAYYGQSVRNVVQLLYDLRWNFELCPSQKCPLWVGPNLLKADDMHVTQNEHSSLLLRRQVPSNHNYITTWNKCKKWTQLGILKGFQSFFVLQKTLFFFCWASYTLNLIKLFLHPLKSEFRNLHKHSSWGSKVEYARNGSTPKPTTSVQEKPFLT